MVYDNKIMSKTFCNVNVKHAFPYWMLLEIVTGIPSTVTVLFYKLFCHLNML